MKETLNQMFKDKLMLVMLVLGLLTIVAAAGVVTIQRGNSLEEIPYMQMEDPGALAEQEESGIQIEVAGNPNARPQEETISQIQYAAQETAAGIQTEEEDMAQAGAAGQAAVPLVLNFTDASRTLWPVRGNILLDYSMDSTIYFPTLDQYQCNPGVVIQAEVSQPVVSPANARVVAVSADEELGNYVVLDLGNEYVATCGQLKEIQVVENEYLEAGQLLGYVAEPTKYYSLEGSNLYFELQHEGKTLDPVGFFE